MLNKPEKQQKSQLLCQEFWTLSRGRSNQEAGDHSQGYRPQAVDKRQLM
jgi:hypothetical protein